MPTASGPLSGPLEDRPPASELSDGTVWVVEKDDGTLRETVVSGDTWVLADTELGSVSADRFDSGEAYAANYDGATLEDKVENAINDLPNGRGRVIANPPDDGGAWEWSSQLTLDPTEYRGIELEFNCRIEHSLSAGEWCIEIDPTNSDNYIQDQLEGYTIDIKGGVWRDGGSTDPAGCIRAVDIVKTTISPRIVRGFRNATNDSAGIELATADQWAEANKIEAYVTANDVSFRGQKQGAGGSFQDNSIRIVGNHNYYGLYLEGGNWQASRFETNVLNNQDAGTGYYFNTNLRDVTWVSMGVEGNRGDSIGIETGPSYAPSPVIIQSDLTNLGTDISRAEPFHEIWAIRTTKNSIMMEDIGRAAIEIGRAGGVSIYAQSGEEVYSFRSDGFIDNVGGFVDGPRYNNGFTHRPEDLTTRSPDSQEVAWHDGSGTPSASLCFESGGLWYNIVDGDTF